MLIRGGENIYPREIEEFLFRHPAVQDVQVFGVPDAKYGEEVCAWIVPAGPARCTRRPCASSAAARSPTTRCRATSASSTQFPLTVTGKAQKFVMRKAMMASLGLTEARTA